VRRGQSESGRPPCFNIIFSSDSYEDEGRNVYVVDASPGMVAAFGARFPDAQTERNAVEDSQFFGRSFVRAPSWSGIDRNNLSSGRSPDGPPANGAPSRA
jgi:hypothetical protein